MTHYSEKTLELLALKNPKVHGQREEILAHLNECKGCSELYAEIQEFYGALSGPDALPQHARESDTELRLSPSYGTSVLQKKVEDRPAIYMWVTQNRKAVASVGTIAIVAAVMMFFALRFGTGTPVAHHAIFDNASQSALIADRGGNVLFSIDIPPIYEPSSLRVVSEMKSVLVEDIDSDGIPEVITWLPFEQDGSVQSQWVRVYRSDGTLAWKKSLGKRLAYGDQTFSNQFSVTGIVTIRNRTSNSRDIIVGAAQNHSPFIFYRLSSSGEILGEYQLMGHAMSFFAQDIQNDSSSILYFSGVIDQGMLDRRPYAAMLDPFLIEGPTEASFIPMPGFGSTPSKAEINVARFPITYLEPFLDKAYMSIGGIKFNQDGNLLVRVNEYLKKSHTQAMWQYVFTRDLIPLRVEITDAIRSVHKELEEKGLVQNQLSPELTDSLAQSITFWDGEKWGDKMPVAAFSMNGLGRQLFNPVRPAFHDDGIDLHNTSGRVTGRISLEEDEVRAYAEWARGSRGIDRKVILTDVDGDGLNDAILYRKGKVGAHTLYTLECRSSDGSKVLWTKPFVWKIDFPGKPDDVVPYYTAGDMYLDDIENDGVQDLIITAGNLSMFPCLVLRLDPRTGAELNTYLHIGHLQAYGIVDLDGDGIKEILLGGVANSYKEAALVVLNGSNFSGVSPSTEEYAPVGWTQGNEKAYFRIPQSIVGEQFWRTTPNIGFVQLDIVPPSRQMHAWVVDFMTLKSENQEVNGTFAVHFSFDLSIKGVSTGSLFDGIASKLYREGTLKRKIDTSYWEEYLSSVKRWNGVTWYTQRIKLGKSDLSME